MCEENYILIYSKIVNVQDRIPIVKKFLYEKETEFGWHEGVPIQDMKLVLIYENENFLYESSIDDVMCYDKKGILDPKKIFLYEDYFWSGKKYEYYFSGALMIETSGGISNVYCLQSLLCEKLKPHLDVEFLKYSDEEIKDYGLGQYHKDERSKSLKKIDYTNIVRVNFPDGSIWKIYKEYLTQTKSSFISDQNYENIYLDMKFKDLQAVIHYIFDIIPVSREISTNLKYLNSEWYCFSVRQLASAFFYDLFEQSTKQF